MTQDTIAAQATPPGKGGVGIIRISGPEVAKIAEAVLGKLPKPRYATFARFLSYDGKTIDEGIGLYFPAPNSFTGEDVLELQGHGGPVVMDILLRRILQLGARLARPGEFSERAFLNNKIDLTQAEAIADLIEASSEQAAQFALRSLQGEFSAEIQQLVQKLTHLRMYVEAAIDFPEEEIDFLSDGKIANDLAQIMQQLTKVQQSAKQGVLLREGMTLVIIGRPNAGKSSLLNQLSGQDVAIVSDIPGTTRDLLREHIHIDGLPIHIIDTAGLRESGDQIEQEGMRRALAAMNKADCILLMTDATDTSINPLALITEPTQAKIIVVRNKIDLLNETPRVENYPDHILVSLSAKTGKGIDLLRAQLKHCLGYVATTEGHFIARRRHLDALAKADEHLQQGKIQLTQYKAGELLAEELYQAQQSLGLITGEVRADDLLGQIFSTFCIGK